MERKARFFRALPEKMRPNCKDPGNGPGWVNKAPGPGAAYGGRRCVLKPFPRPAKGRPAVPVRVNRLRADGSPQAGG